MRPRLLNNYEEITYERLNEACDRVGARVFPKVRVADVVSLSDLKLTSEEYTYGLKSHFDFLVTNSDYSPLFSVEYDGEWHKRDATQIKRDGMKESICDRADHALLRINSRYLNREFRGLDLLTYFVDVWFLREAFEQAKESGASRMMSRLIPLPFVRPDGTTKSRGRIGYRSMFKCGSINCTRRTLLISLSRHIGSEWILMATIVA